jgi:hypothetical protein
MAKYNVSDKLTITQNILTIILVALPFTHIFSVLIYDIFNEVVSEGFIFAHIYALFVVIILKMFLSLIQHMVKASENYNNKNQD